MYNELPEVENLRECWEKDTNCFHRIGHDISDDCDLLHLTYTVDTIDGLRLHHRIPMRLYQMHNTSGSKIYSVSR